MRNKKIPFFFVSIIVSMLLHITILIALPISERFPFIATFTHNAMLIDLREGIKSANTPMKTSGPILQLKKSEKEGSEETIVSKKGHETSIENHNEGYAEQILKDNAATKTSADSGKTPEKTTYEGTENEEIRTGEPRAKTKSFQIARAKREKFSYDIYWLGLHVGNASLEAVDVNGLLTITSLANSSGFISAFYKVEDYAQSQIRDGIPVHFRIKQHEGKYRSNKETIYDADNKNVTFFNYLKGIKKEHAVRDGDAWDVISGFYYLRTQPLDIGKTVCINIFDSNKFYKAEINVLKKEKIKIPGIGEMNTLIVRPELKTEGLFQRKGDVLIWLTDDEKRIPVRIETKVPVGDVVVELRDIVMEE